jgi:molybdate transport system permease protein
MSSSPALRRPTGSALVVAFAYAACTLLVLGSAFLFLSNLPGLWPPELAASPEMESWRDAPVRELAGGFWKQASFWRSLRLSLLTATLTALCAALIGIPAAHALSRARLPGRGAIDLLFSSLIVLPSSSVGLCLIVLFQHGPLRDLQELLGIRVPHTIFPGIVVAQLVLSLAIGLSAWRAAFDGVNPRFEEVAHSLGAGPFRVFRTVTLPLAAPGLFAGLILAWVRAAAEFGAVLLFCGTFRELPIARFSGLERGLGVERADILPVAIWAELEYGNLELGMALGFALLAITALSVYALHRLGGKGYVW